MYVCVRVYVRVHVSAEHHSQPRPRTHSRCRFQLSGYTLAVSTAVEDLGQVMKNNHTVEEPNASVTVFVPCADVIGTLPSLLVRSRHDCVNVYGCNFLCEIVRVCARLGLRVCVRVCYVCKRACVSVCGSLHLGCPIEIADQRIVLRLRQT